MWILSSFAAYIGAATHPNHRPQLLYSAKDVFASIKSAIATFNHFAINEHNCAKNNKLKSRYD